MQSRQHPYEEQGTENPFDCARRFPRSTTRWRICHKSYSGLRKSSIPGRSLGICLQQRSSGSMFSFLRLSLLQRQNARDVRIWRCIAEGTSVPSPLGVLLGQRYCNVVEDEVLKFRKVQTDVVISNVACAQVTCEADPFYAPSRSHAF